VMRKSIENLGISEELRGYAWDRPPVEPINGVRVSVSDLNGFCPTRRDIYLKYVLKEKPQVNAYMLRGLACHKVIRETITALKKAVYSGCESGEEIIDNFYGDVSIPEKICGDIGVKPDYCIRLYRVLVIQAAAKVDEVLSKYPDADAENIVGLAFPPFMERKIDGSPVGLSKNLSLDVFTPHSIIMDFKTGVEKYEHMLSLTGYALALEADDETDINFGFVIYIRFGRSVQFVQKEFVVGDELRREFIEVRDEIAELIESGIDPGKPAQCPKYCSFSGVCNEGSC